MNVFIEVGECGNLKLVNVAVEFDLLKLVNVGVRLHMSRLKHLSELHTDIRICSCSLSSPCADGDGDCDEDYDCM